MFNFIKQHKALSLLIFLNIVAVLIVILIIVVHGSKTATIDVMVTPREAVIELNGLRYENLRSHNITPGDYHVKISMEGMQTKEYDFSIERDGFVRIWNYLLDANGGFDYYLSHPNDEVILENIADDEVKKWLKKYDEIMSIREVLPLGFSSTFDPNATEIVSVDIRWGTQDECDPESYCLIIQDLTGKNHEKALQTIRDAGYNPDNYIIVFKDGLD